MSMEVWGIVRQMKNFETDNAKTICVELKKVKKKWCIIFVYWPLDTNMLLMKSVLLWTKYLAGMTTILCRWLKLMYWWIDELKTGSDSSNHLSEAKDIFNHTILIKKPTYFKLQDKNPIDLMLTNTKKRYDPFLWIGFSCFKVSEPPQGDSLFFTIQFPGVSGVQLIDLNKKKDWVDPGATQWFWIQNPWIGNPAP